MCLRVCLYRIVLLCGAYVNVYGLRYERKADPYNTTNYIVYGYNTMKLESRPIRVITAAAKSHENKTMDKRIVV